MSKASALQNATANKPQPTAKPVKEEKEAISLSLEDELAKVATESNADPSGNGARKNTKPPGKVEPKAPPKFVEPPYKNAGQAVVPPKQMLPERGTSKVRKTQEPEAKEPPKPQPAPEQNLDHNVVPPKTPPGKVSPKLVRTQPPEPGPSVGTQSESEVGPSEGFPPAWEFGLNDGSATPEHLFLPIPVRRAMKFNRNLERYAPRPDLGAIPYMPFSTPKDMSPAIAYINEMARAHQQASRDLADAYRMMNWGSPAWNVRSGWGIWQYFLNGWE